MYQRTPLEWRGFFFVQVLDISGKISQTPLQDNSTFIIRDMKKLMAMSLLFSSQAFSGVYFENQWQHYNVSTCFAEGEQINREQHGYVLKVRPWKEKNKRLVQQWVSEEFSAERTGIHFSGFKNCEEEPNAEVIIFYNKNSKFGTFLFGGINGLGLLGPNQGSVTGYPAAAAFVSISSSGMDKGTVIHEFGHIAGLQHEHIHYDAFKLDKGRCSSITKENSSFSTNWRYTEYDRDSVMNYCRIHEKGGSKAGLSSKDVELLKKLYP